MNWFAKMKAALTERADDNNSKVQAKIVKHGQLNSTSQKHDDNRNIHLYLHRDIGKGNG